jgi:serine/threonine-protein kinase
VLDRELASGGMARVYLATLRGAVGFEKRLVVKQIRPELASDPAFVRRFVDEAKTAVELSHPNIVPVYELGVEQGVYYIAMEFCAGATLAELLAETGAVSPEEGAYLGVEICRALDYAHRRAGIVHRDVTPRNVLIDEEGAVRLIDFGIAAPASTQRLEAPLDIFGSPGHMPPEQMSGERLTPATDIFAIGALLVEAWTGRPPFRRSTLEESAEALRAPLPSLDRDHPELEPVAAIIAQSLELDASRRPQDADSLARKLREFSRAFDSGDVAKRLGAKIRRIRVDAPERRWTPLTETPVTPDRDAPASAPVTATFAARQDLLEWTRKLGSESPAPEPRSRAVDEPVTRALEDAAPPRHRSRAVIGLGLAAAVLGSFALWQFRPSDRAARPRAQPSAFVAHSTLPKVTPPPLPGPSSVAAVPAASVVAASSSTVRPISTSTARLRLTADPQASVTVSGARLVETRRTPVLALPVPPGTYSVVFRSPIFGEPVATQVDLRAGESHSVHADFRAAVPTVVVR